ncbi:hypothetical protein SAMN05216257_103450 [Meinhardsimonia xiamenensis]|jgi:ApbE superfamily uncharacterized protein (UPF0280 family)|uniref:Uncharacterized protein n=1 Tax=Meinhardsimonia xiamenensis TaxID=990712 RepID=A0A1G9DDC7_9RHOB|nr:UPF0280 family protein [Meinhardsimonia xiamenensis]PRX38031.1 hypothetical protein LV81_00304 [Meinhardsimonia xiamenensis]SDK61898.1 hypothetical protein SAMN05216257_103450 [Meinhardsimonia xiamenensis]
MSGRAQAAWLPDGRLHLHHGPIDLIVSAEAAGRDPAGATVEGGARPGADAGTALAAAAARFETVLDELVAELPLLRAPVDADAPPAVAGVIARRMVAAVRPWARVGFITPMAAVAGAVADEILAAMRAAAPLAKAIVNNGGDVALWLAPGQRTVAAVAGGAPARLELSARDGIGGVATSGWRGRSHSLGIADAVTVLAASAAAADAAATMIANAVDLPGHPSVRRRPACEIAPDSDLGALPVTVAVGALTGEERARALACGARRAREAAGEGLIRAAFLSLGGDACAIGAPLGICTQGEEQDRERNQRRARP